MIASGALRNETKCVLLTGGTGFVGQYLLRDFLAKEISVVAIARKRKGVTAEERIHRIIRIWEASLGRTLSRPKVMEWDIHHPAESCFTSTQIAWLREHVDTIVHSAASVRFEWDRQRSEPFRSNVEGTKHVAHLARRLRDVHVHHLSTAYVCGNQSGTVYEEILKRTDFRNPYEESKSIAEKLLSDSQSQFGSLTIYRPSIVVGDSKTGFASHFQTIYAGLRLVSLYKDKENRSIESFFDRLGIGGQEGKNLIPVDLLSDAITRLVLNPSARGLIYHLTSGQIVTISEIAQAMKLAIEQEPAAWNQMETIQDVSLEAVTEAFLQSYRSYFVDDAQFDRRHTLKAIPHAEQWCVDSEQLVRMFRHAIREKFEEAEWKTESSVSSKLRELRQPDDAISIYAKPWVMQAIEKGELTVKHALQMGSVLVVGQVAGMNQEELIRKRLQSMSWGSRTINEATNTSRSTRDLV